MKSVVLPDENNNDVDVDLALSIGGVFRTLPEKSTASGSSFTLWTSDGDEEDSGVTDAKNRGQIRRRETKRKRDEEDERNPPLKREKKLQGVGYECRNGSAELMPYPYSSLQYVPFMNGFVFPCVVPYWAAAGHGGERTVHQPVACRSFRPFETDRRGSDGFSNGRKNRKTGSSGSSPVCSSSVISENYQSSSSHEGGGSSYTRNNSCNSSSDQHQMRCPNPKPNTNDSMNHDKPKPCSENRTQCEEKSGESHVHKKEPITASSNKSVFNSQRSPSMSIKNMKMENEELPKPQILSQNVPSLQQMPYVSTTGVGPNGKTITGFLYRYSNLEVSILCVCHGESFSPAEFVKHAGGEEISHPLRHITVLPTNGIPSAIR